jgi:hypothetical protein
VGEKEVESEIDKAERNFCTKNRKINMGVHIGSIE